jgi:hypothetical protein
MSLWELAWLAQNGHIQVAGTVEPFVQACVSRVMIRPLTATIPAYAARLPAAFREIGKTDSSLPPPLWRECHWSPLMSESTQPNWFGQFGDRMLWYTHRTTMIYLSGMD